MISGGLVDQAAPAGGDPRQQGTAGKGDFDGGDMAFYHYHTYAFPLLYMLDLFVDGNCFAENDAADGSTVTNCGRTGPIVLDLRGMVQPLAAAAVSRRAWDEAAVTF